MKKSKRVFPRAKVTFLLPPIGLHKVDAAYIDSLPKDIKSAAVPIRQARTGSVKGMISGDNIHVNGRGKAVLRDSIKRVLPSKPRDIPIMSGRRSNDNFRKDNFRIDNSNFPHLSSEHAPDPTQNTYTQGGYVNDRGYRNSLDFRSQNVPPSRDLTPSAPPQNSVPSKMAKEILQFVANLMAD